MTIRISPTLWQDEAQIVDWGRAVAFDPSSSWSMNWTPKGPVPLLPAYGAILQEMAFRLSGLSPIGPRFISLLSALLASTLCAVWLSRRGASTFVTLTLSAAFLVDPVVVQSYKGGRIDLLAIAAVFGSCLLLRQALRERRRDRGRLVLAGTLAALAVAIWPSAVLTLPLLLLEWAEWLVDERPELSGSRGVLASALVMATAGGLVLTLLLTVMWARQSSVIGSPIDAVREMLQAQTSSHSAGRRSLGQVAKDALAVVRLSPALWAYAMLCAFLPRARLAAAAGAAAWIVILGTSVYTFRVLYAIPFAIVIIANAHTSGFNGRISRQLHRFAIAAVVGFAVLASVVLRPAVALSQSRGRDPSIVYRMATSNIGPGAKRVFVDAWEFYYPGRELGWQMFRPFPGGDTLVDVLGRVDYAIVASRNLSPVFSEKLSSAGLDQYEVAQAPTEQSSTWLPVAVGAEPYRSYHIFRRGSAKAQVEPATAAASAPDGR